MLDRSRRPVVLVVEDEASVREVIRDVLEPEYDVVTAADGKAALAAFRRRPVDAVLLDLRLPGVSGLDVLRRMKAIDPRVEIVLVTATHEVPVVVEVMKAGAFDYITKPFHLDRLLATVARAVSRRVLAGDIVLVTRRIGLFTAVHVVAERMLGSVVSLSPEAALKGLGGEPPRLIVVNGPPQAVPTLEIVRRLRRRHRDCPVVVIAPEVDSLDAIVERVAAELATRADGRPAVPALGASVVAAAEHVSRHYRDTLRTEDLARAVGVSAVELGRAFREAIGITPRDFVARFRVAAVCYRLIDRGSKLEHIAAATGFLDASHLSRVFTGQVGIRPGEYRRRLRRLAG